MPLTLQCRHMLLRARREEMRMSATAPCTIFHAGMSHASHTIQSRRRHATSRAVDADSYYCCYAIIDTADAAAMLPDTPRPAMRDIAATALHAFDKHAMARIQRPCRCQL